MLARWAAQAEQALPANAWRAWSDRESELGMEASLGIRLQPEKVPADVIVVDQVDRHAPS